MARQFVTLSDPPRQNRVTPQSTLIAHPARGLLMGNRGCLHDPQGRIVRSFSGKRWICCLTAFKGRRRELMQHGRYTELFFLDEAVALAAGHRPCAECRRADYLRFGAAWCAAGLGDKVGATQMDALLHRERLTPVTKRQKTSHALLHTLPDAAFVLVASKPHLVWQGRLFPYQPEGYGPALSLPGSTPLTVLTPTPILLVLRYGYAPQLHPSCLGGQ